MDYRRNTSLPKLIEVYLLIRIKPRFAHGVLTSGYNNS